VQWECRSNNEPVGQRTELARCFSALAFSIAFSSSPQRRATVDLAADGATMAGVTRHDFERNCNEMLAKLVCPKHKTTPDPARIVHIWSGNKHVFFSQSPWCPGSVGPCDEFGIIMARKVTALAVRLGPIVDSN
jgi:hypothetical protein